MYQETNQGFIKIQSTELLFFENELAGIGSRGLAYFIDTLIKGVAIFLFALFFAWVNLFGKSFIPIVVFLILFAGYHFFFEAIYGKTPGKHLAGIRVIKSDGSRLSFLDSFVRNILRVVDVLPFGYMAGMVMIFLERYNRRLGDIVGDTLVIHDRAAKRSIKKYIDSRLLEAKSRDAVVISGVSNLSAKEKGVIKTLYLRIDKMAPAQKEKTLEKFWEVFSKKLHITGTEDPEILLYELYKQI